MTLVVLSGVAAAHIGAGSPLVVKGALLYVAIQTLLSYFVAGVVKLANAEWRRGYALRAFIAQPGYSVPALVSRILHTRLRVLVASWAVIIFECSVPAAVVSAQSATIFAATAFTFHIGNAYAFGLNRFLPTWAAAWPAVLFVAGGM